MQGAPPLKRRKVQLNYDGFGKSLRAEDFQKAFRILQHAKDLPLLECAARIIFHPQFWRYNLHHMLLYIGMRVNRYDYFTQDFTFSHSQFGVDADRAKALSVAGLNYHFFGFHLRRFADNYLLWTPKHHTLCSTLFQRQILTLLMCFNRKNLKFPREVKFILVRCCAVGFYFYERATTNAVRLGERGRRALMETEFLFTQPCPVEVYVEKMCERSIFYHPIPHHDGDPCNRNLRIGYYLREEMSREFGLEFGLGSQFDLQGPMNEMLCKLPDETLIYILERFKRDVNLIDFVHWLILWDKKYQFKLVLKRLPLKEFWLDKIASSENFHNETPKNMRTLIQLGLVPLKSTAYKYTIDDLHMQYWLDAIPDHFQYLTPQMRAAIRTWLLVNRRLKLVDKHVARYIATLMPRLQVLQWEARNKYLTYS